jgi:hypothetical protein
MLCGEVVITQTRKRIEAFKILSAQQEPISTQKRGRAAGNTQASATTSASGFAEEKEKTLC